MFLENILVSTLRPDIIVVSETMRQVVLLELTVPWADLIDQAFKRNVARYEKLADESRGRGWRTR